MSKPLHWWQEGVIYQIVVSSFLDTNGDGEGDLNGVIARLDYLKWLGVTAIWLTPIYPSPMDDLGYDVSDYTSVNPQFGSVEDFDRLIAQAHDRGMKILLDWVPNHTSDAHLWFVESRVSRDNPKRDWYLWSDGKVEQSELGGTSPESHDGLHPPNNWISVFGGSAWQWDDKTKQFYYHSFLESQPDLNWRNTDVRAAVFDAMRFWLNRGVDGFRIDAVSWLIKDDQFRDNPPNPNYNPEKDGPDQQVVPLYTWDQPQVHDVIAEMRRVVDEFDDRMLVGELVLPVDRVVTYYGDEKQPELHLPLNLHLVWTDWTVEELSQVIENYQQYRPQHGWPTWTISTHDFPRVAARVPGEQARVAAMLLLTLGGTPTHYYGEEIGMKGVPIPPQEARDPQGQRIGRNRDPARTPMQWDGGQQGGFTDGRPWLPIGDDLQTANVAVQSEDPQSLLTLYRRLIKLRREHPVLVHSELEFVSCESQLLSYRRSSEQGNLLIILNLGSEPLTYSLDGETVGESGARLLMSTFLDRENELLLDTVFLRLDEGVILERVRVGQSE
jgi:alpha-glucosidase